MPNIDSIKRGRRDWHRADIVAAVWKAGTSLRQLSFDSDLSPTTIQKALQHPYPKAERIIADAIGLRPKDIWPSRYDDQGNPKSGRPYTLQVHTSPAVQGNGKAVAGE